MVSDWSSRAEFTSYAGSLPLVDHHVHGATKHPLSRDAFEDLVIESDRPRTPGTTQFDSQIGFAILRWCPPLLGLDPFTGADAYLARRAELGVAEVNRRFLSACGIGEFLLDTGFGVDTILDLEAMAETSGARCREIVRLESVAEEVIVGGDAEGFAKAFDAALDERLANGSGARRVVGVKSVIAYRSGFDVDLSRPDPARVSAAAGRWLAEIGATGRVRCTEPAILAHLLWAAIDRGSPLQLHVGFGDTDLDLARVNPLLLTDFLRASEPSGTPVLLLHCYPFHREAGYLAQMFPHVYFDVGLAVNYTGAQSRTIVAESLELAPFTKQMFSSDAWGPAELHYIGAVLWRRAMVDVVSGWVEAGDWSAANGRRVLSLVGVDNAQRVYRLD